MRPSAKPRQVQNFERVRHIISAKPPHSQVNISDPKPEQTGSGPQKFLAPTAASTV